MFTHYRTQGFILKKTDRGEADRVFTVYTKDFGKLSLLAKAERKIKSKLRGGLELFYLSEVEFIQGKTHKTLTDAILLNSFGSLRKSLKKLAVAHKVSDILDRLVKGQEPDENLWQLLGETFEKLDDPSFKINHLPLIYYYFFWNLLSFLGYQPELYNCSICQKKIQPQDIFFSAKEGGLICSSCQKTTKSKKPIGPETVKIIRVFLKRDWPTLKRLRLKEDSQKDISFISRYFLRSVLSQIE